MSKTESKITIRKTAHTYNSGEEKIHSSHSSHSSHSHSGSKIHTEESSHNSKGSHEAMSLIRPRIAVAHTSTGRLSGGYSGAGTRNLAILTDAEYFGISPDMSNQATKLFLQSTGREKATLHSLNDRLAEYMKRVQQYEIDNQKVRDDWEAVSKATITTDSHKYTEYTAQLEDLRKRIDRAFAEKAKVEAMKLVLEADLRNYRFRHEELQNGQLNLGRYTALLADSRSEAVRLQGHFKQLKGDLDGSANDNRIGWDNVRAKTDEWGRAIQDCNTYKYQSQARMDELMTFVHDVQEQMVMKLEKKTHVGQKEISEELKDDLAQAIRDITVEYVMISEQAKSETEKWYELKYLEAKQLAERKKTDFKFPHAKVDQLTKEISIVRSNIASIEREIADLQHAVSSSSDDFTNLKFTHKEQLFDHETRMRALLQERQHMAETLQGILDTMQLHDAEMAIYRTMLEGEERRVGIGYERPAPVRHIDSTGAAISTMAYYKTKGEHVRVKFCDLLGKYIVLENISNPPMTQDIGGWQVHRTVDLHPTISYTLPDNLTLRPGDSIEIYAKGHEVKTMKPNALIFDNHDASWGAGINIKTTVHNRDGVEVATHIQGPEKIEDDSD